MPTIYEPEDRKTFFIDIDGAYARHKNKDSYEYYTFDFSNLIKTAATLGSVITEVSGGVAIDYEGYTLEGLYYIRVAGTDGEIKLSVLIPGPESTAYIRRLRFIGMES